MHNIMKSNTSTASDTQDDLTHNPEIVTHTSNGNFEKNELLDHLCLAPANETGDWSIDFAGCIGATYY